MLTSNLLKNFVWLLLVVLIRQPMALSAPYYVSIDGSDANVGTNLSAPFRTIQKCASVIRAGDNCFIRAGTYRETVTPANSGANGAPVVFAPYNNERVIISGANIVTGFSTHQGNIFKAPVSWDMGKGKNQVFMTGVVQVEARFPNVASAGMGYPVEVSPLFPALGDFHVPDNTTNQVTSPLLNGQGTGLWRGGIYAGAHTQAYQFQTADITDSNSGGLTVTPINPGKWYNQSYSWLSQLGRGYISGVLNALDTPGEWVIQGGYLYLQTPQGQNPNSITIEAKARQLAFNLSQKSYITIKNLEIVAASMSLDGASNILIDGNKFSYVSQFIRAENPNGSIDSVNGPSEKAPHRGEVGIFIGGHNNTFTNSIIAHSAGAGLYVTGKDHVITNNIIHDCAYAGMLSNIVISVDMTTEAGTDDRGGHVVSFNTMYNSGGATILILRDVVYYNATGRGLGPGTPFRKMRIVDNLMYNMNLLLRDSSGGLYTFGTNGNGTEIANNVIHDVLEVGGFGMMLVYCDEGSRNYNIHENIFWKGRETGGVGAAVMMNGETTAGFYSKVGVNFEDTATGRTSWGNNYKFNYSGGVAGLTNADFPGGQRFNFGANFSETTSPPPTTPVSVRPLAPHGLMIK